MLAVFLYVIKRFVGEFDQGIVIVAVTGNVDGADRSTERNIHILAHQVFGHRDDLVVEFSGDLGDHFIGHDTFGKGHELVAA